MDARSRWAADDQSPTGKVPPIRIAEFRAPARNIGGRRLQRLRLPLIARRLRIPAIVAGGLLLVGLFALPERIHLWPPIPLGRSIVDDWIPFLPWTIWVYLSEYLFLIVAIWFSVDDRRRSDCVYGLVLAAIIGLVIFMLLPTSVMRDPPDFGGITGFVWHCLFALDTTGNALPSLHVANTCLAAIALASRRGVWRVAIVAWAILIMLSTLTTKQHYAIDVAGGLLLAAICFFAVRFAVEYRRLEGFFGR